MKRLFAAIARLATFAAACALACSASAQPQVGREHAIPSCYDQLKEYAPRAALGDLTVLIDQTAYLDARLRQIVHETVDRLIRPGVNVSIATFSAYLQGRYLDVLVSGQVESPIEPGQRDFVSKRELRQNDQCLSDQLVFARRLAAKTLDAAFQGTDPSIARSDILMALGDLSRRVGDVQARGRMVLVVSDMLENSSIASFYRNNELRTIEPAAELRKAASAGIKADFLGARVFVIGAGGVSDRRAGDRSYRDPRALLALEDFWRRWFEASHGELIEFGKPAPLVKINWSAPELAATESR